MKNPEIYMDGKKNDLIARLTQLAESNDFVFRGFENQDELYPSIVRKNVTDFESCLLSYFEKYGVHYINATNPIDFLSYAQHFGLATRLLDFTANPFVALYFSLFNPKRIEYTCPEDKDFYYLRYAEKEANLYYTEFPVKLSQDILDGGTFPDEQNENQDLEPTLKYSLASQARCMIYEVEKLYQTNNSNTEQDKRLTDGIQQGKLLLIDPNQANQRIIMQQGLFMLPYTLDREKHIELISKNTSLIKVHKSLREPIQRYLNAIGINAFRLMPDLQNICDAIMRNVTEERS
jgi:hypothetical protein